MASTLFTGVTRLGPLVHDAATGLASAMIEGVESLVRHLRDGTPLLCRGEDGVAALAAVEAAEHSLEADRLIRPATA